MEFLTYDEAINQIYTLQEYVQLVNDYEEKDLKGGLNVFITI